MTVMGVLHISRALELLWSHHCCGSFVEEFWSAAWGFVWGYATVRINVRDKGLQALPE